MVVRVVVIVVVVIVVAVVIAVVVVVMVMVVVVVVVVVAVLTARLVVVGLCVVRQGPVLLFAGPVYARWRWVLDEGHPRPCLNTVVSCGFGPGLVGREVSQVYRASPWRWVGGWFGDLARKGRFSHAKDGSSPLSTQTLL